MNTQLLKQNNEVENDYLNYGLLGQSFKHWIIRKFINIPEWIFEKHNNSSNVYLNV